MQMKYRLICYSLCILGSLHAQNNDSLMRLSVNEALPDTVRLHALTELSWNFLASDLDQARAMAEKELALARQAGNERYVAQAYNDLGIVLMQKGRFRDALQQHGAALVIRKKLGRQSDIASSYSKIGFCHTELSELIPALQADLSALAIYERTGPREYEALMLSNICEVYSKMHNYRNLLPYANKSFALARELDSPLAMGRAMNYIAAAREGERKPEEAIRAQEKALQYFITAGDSASMAASYNNLGYYLRQANEDEKAVVYYKKALDIAEATGDAYSLMGYYKNVGSVYSETGRLKEAQIYLDKAWSCVTPESAPEELITLHRALGDLRVRQGRGKEAFPYYQRAIQMNDSIFSEELARQFSDMQVKYEAEKKNSENLQLQNENALKTTELNRSRLIQVSLIAGIVLLGLVFLLLYNRNRFRQRRLMDAELLRQKQLRSNAVIEAEENERTRIARDLHDGIGQQLSAARLNVSGLQSLARDKTGEESMLLQNALALLDESVKEVRQVSHQMMANTLLRSGLPHAVKEFMDRIGSRYLRVNLEIDGLAQRLDPGTEIVIFRVLQEAVNNIMRHANATEITLQMVKYDAELSVLVEDNGNGFHVEEVLRSNSGLGLRNIRSRVEFLNGQVFFDSYPGKGTTVNISIPL